MRGTPVSLQTARPQALVRWKERVREAYLRHYAAHHWASTSRMSVSLYYFPDGRMQGDIDNIIKPVLDALSQLVYVDDEQVDRIVAQRLDANSAVTMPFPSVALVQALEEPKPVLYIRVSDDPLEDMK